MQATMASFSAQQKMFIQNLEKINFVQKIMRHEMFQVFLMPLDESFICEGEKTLIALLFLWLENSFLTSKL